MAVKLPIPDAAGGQPARLRRGVLQFAVGACTCQAHSGEAPPRCWGGIGESLEDG